MHRKIFFWVSACFVAVAIAIMVWKITYSQLSGDGAIFFAMGRFLLNGGTIYKDLFETKPPGIFFLSALALLFSGEQTAQIFVACALLIITLVPIFLAPRRGLFIGLMAALMAFFTDGFSAEMFGTASLMLYLLVTQLRIHNLWKIILSSITLFLAIFFKEPFLFVAPAMALLLFQKWESFLWLYLIPQVLGIVLFLAVLFCLGDFWTYLTMYLPFMIHTRVGGSPVSPWFIPLRFWEFSPLLIPLLAYAFPLKKWKRAIGIFFFLAITLYIANLSGRALLTALPILVTLLLLAKRRWILQGLIATLLLSPLLYAFPFQSHTHTLTEEKAVAATVDRILDRCHEHSYYNLGNGNYVFAFTKHSPSGPMLYTEYYLLQNPYLVMTTLANLKKVDLILFEKQTHVLSLQKEYLDHTEEEVLNNFTMTPWPCAQSETIDTDQYVLLFRKDVR